MRGHDLYAEASYLDIRKLTGATPHTYFNTELCSVPLLQKLAGSSIFSQSAEGMWYSDGIIIALWLHNYMASIMQITASAFCKQVLPW